VSLDFLGIREFLTWLVGWLPTCEICEITHRGVKVTGTKIRPIKPGIYWYWPRWTKVYTCSVVSEVYDLPTQSVDSSDGEPIMFSVSLVCRVRNVEKWLTGVENGEDIIKEIGAGAATDCIASRDRDTILEDFTGEGKLEVELFEAAGKALSRRYGVEVVEARLTDCCKHHCHRVEGGAVAPTTSDDEE